MTTIAKAIRWIGGFLAGRHGHEPALPPAPQQVRIVSDGAAHTTSIYVDGVPLVYATACTWSVRTDELAHAWIEVENVAVDVVGERAA